LEDGISRFFPQPYRSWSILGKAMLCWAVLYILCHENSRTHWVNSSIYSVFWTQRKKLILLLFGSYKSFYHYLFICRYIKPASIHCSMTAIINMHALSYFYSYPTVPQYFAPRMVNSNVFLSYHYIVYKIVRSDMYSLNIMQL